MAPKSKKVQARLKLELPAGQASPAPPVGPAIAPTGVNIMDFVKAYNDATKSKSGIIPVEVTIYADRTFSMVIKTPPAAYLIRQKLGIEKGSGVPNKEKVGTLTRDQVREIAEIKMPDITANDIDAAMKIVEGTARSMGVLVE